MKNESIINRFLKLLMVQLVIFSISNMIIVIRDTYYIIFEKKRNGASVKFFNPMILFLSIVISIAIILTYICIIKVRKKPLKIKRMDNKVFFFIGIPFLISSIVLFLGNIYQEFNPISGKNISINRYSLVIIGTFIMITIILIYTLISIIRNRALFISKIGLRLIFVIGIAFVASIVLLNSISKFTKSYLLDYNNIAPQTFVRTYNTIASGFIVVVIVAFILIILTAINKRIEYLNYMTSQVKKISEIKYLDELIIKGNDELSELASSINIMSTRLKDSYELEKKNEQAKNELIVAVSHDLRTPLTSIIGYLELLNNKYTYGEEQKEYLDIVYRKSLSLKKLMEELFEYTKLTNDYIILEKIPFNIAILINQIVGEHIPFFENKNIKVEIESFTQELWCEIDVHRLVRVIENIVKNAENYSFTGTTFKVYMMELNDNIKITFENIGPQIDKEDLEKMFEKMYRLDKSRASDNEGSGLGLAISKKIVELHGGELWCECQGNTIKFIMLLQKS